ncbi:MAG: hypothetical protein IPQ28_01165 [Sphingobacteriales bacterium]|nr:hypothetical protein [Sphingobacteriales bacterium]
MSKSLGNSFYPPNDLPRPSVLERLLPMTLRCFYDGALPQHGRFYQ